MTTVDFGGTERTEDYYFNLTRAEIMQMICLNSWSLRFRHTYLAMMRIVHEEQSQRGICMVEGSCA